MEDTGQGAASQRRVAPEAWYANLMAHASLDGLSREAALDHVAQLVDVADHLKREEGLTRAITWGEGLRAKEQDGEAICRLDYYLGNAWAAFSAARREGPEERWAWERPETQRALVHYRRALSPGEGKPGVAATYRCRVLTNLANQYSTVGRAIVAIDCWTQVLAEEPAFGMARGNRGLALKYYASVEYDPGHARLLLGAARGDIVDALACGVEPHARADFETARDGIDRVLSGATAGPTVAADTSSLGASDAERVYREWCLRERLFLNTLNDLGPVPVAARDALHCPSTVVPVAQTTPIFYGLYNQMKQEYVAARYLLYEGLTATESHFADADVLLYDTLDYPSLSLNVEKVRLAFRAAYSLLDKVAYFLNSYLALGMAPNRVQFRTVWYEGGQRRNGLRECFCRHANWPLRGLFWLSKDLVARGTDYRDAIEPDARELAAIRNHLEHRYLEIHEHEPVGYGTADQGDEFALHIGGDEFGRKTLRLMRMARAALTYLSLAVHVEEQRRASERAPGPVIPGVPLIAIEAGHRR